NAVDAPQQRDLVACHMFEPDGEVEQHEGYDACENSVCPDLAKKSPTLGFGPECRAHGGRGKDDPQDSRRDDEQRQVGEPAPRLPGPGHLGAFEPRRPQLIGGHGGEYGDESEEPDYRLRQDEPSHAPCPSAPAVPCQSKTRERGQTSLRWRARAARSIAAATS